MKARYAKTFEYGKQMAKTSVICAVAACAVSIFFLPAESTIQLVGLGLSAVLMIATLVIMYKYCRCPYCGKHILMGVLTVKACPACRRNLESGKKAKK